MHKKENMGLVELATVSFGQSFQITPIQLITTASSIINGGRRITPHFAMNVESTDGTYYQKFSFLCMIVAASPGRSIPVFPRSPNCSK